MSHIHQFILIPVNPLSVAYTLADALFGDTHAAEKFVSNAPCSMVTIDCDDKREITSIQIDPITK